MATHYIGEGLVIRKEGNVLEFLRRAGTKIFFEDGETGTISGFEECDFWDQLQRNEISILETFASPKELIYEEAAQKLPVPLDAKYELSHLRKLEYVKGIQKRKITRGQLKFIEEAIREIAKEINDPKPPAHMTVTAWMRKLERANGDIYVLVSGHAKKGERQRQAAEHDALIGDVIDEYYLTQQQLTAAQVYTDYYLAALKDLNAERMAAGEPEFEPIADRTFYRRIHRIDDFEVTAARLGREEARRIYRMSKGHMPADYPLHVVEIDHAQLNLWVVDDVLMLPLGRPWITAFRDRRTGMVVGFYISFRGPSLSSIFGALRHSLYPHSGLKELFPDLEHDCIAFGLADTYASDRGRDFLSPKYRYAVHQLHAEYEYLEKRTPWHKPNIERLFLTLHRDLLETAPGKVFPGLSYSREYNPQRDAVVRFSTLIYLIVKWAVDYHPFVAARKRGPCPYDLWMDEISDAPPPLPPNIDALKVIAGIRESATLGSEGIRYKHLTYGDGDLERYFRQVGRTAKTEFVVCDENLGRILVNNLLEKRWMEIGCTHPDYAEGLSLYQHQLILRSSSQKDRSDVQQLMRTRERLQAIFAEELDRKSNAGKTKIARYLNISSSAVLDGNPNSISSMLLPDKREMRDERVAIADAAFTDIPHFGWRSA